MFILNELFKSEDEFVNFIKKFEFPHPFVQTGTGDDACIINFQGQKIAITTDSYRENVHFRMQYLNFFEIGYRCTAGALSDLAACGAQPVILLVSLLLPDGFKKKFIEEFYNGINEVSKKFGAPITGGDLIKGGKDFCFTITCVGKIKGEPLLRKGAKKGELLCITGDIGRVYAAIEILENKIEVSPDIKDKIIQKFKFPLPRIAEILDLIQRIKITSAIDISDGLAKDAWEISRKSGVKIIIEEGKLPVVKELIEYALTLQKDPMFYILNSGEEYEILFTVPAHQEKRLPSWVKVIGKIEEGQGVYLKRKSGEIAKIEGGFDYFR